uniref:Uncharacterized protein n=1 Tax=Arundo donax TaxID=35708 RepID=A0A0A8ZIF0_ARUDO
MHMRLDTGKGGKLLIYLIVDQTRSISVERVPKVGLHDNMARFVSTDLCPSEPERLPKSCFWHLPSCLEFDLKQVLEQARKEERNSRNIGLDERRLTLKTRLVSCGACPQQK